MYFCHLRACFFFFRSSFSYFFNCCCNHCHVLYSSLLKEPYCHHLLCFSLCHFLSAAFSLFVLYLFVCVAGVGLGSSPTSSQNEALPPSTDWPVSGYTSSFSLSSPEMEDAGTWFIHNHPPTPSPHCSG